MSDTPTNANGLLVTTYTAYLYDRNGTFVAQANLASGIADADKDARDFGTAYRTGLAVAWAESLGYRLRTNVMSSQGWIGVGGDGVAAAVEYVGALVHDDLLHGTWHDQLDARTAG
jgi:hypothetical protein